MSERRSVFHTAVDADHAPVLPLQDQLEGEVPERQRYLDLMRDADAALQPQLRGSSSYMGASALVQ